MIVGTDIAPFADIARQWNALLTVPVIIQIITQIDRILSDKSAREVCKKRSEILRRHSVRRMAVNNR